MARIQILAPSVREKIAAGEVIERPASVVKELVENSLDAGATEIAVILEAGGKSLIEIIDNGHGMSPDDLELSVQRHATSKLRSMEDLDHLLTLGFRGEALPSVAAVSELGIVSRTQENPDGAAYELRAATDTEPARLEKATFGHFLGSPHGTRIRAQGLFAQIPARLKFLKSQGAEVAQVREWLERLALTHPATSFRLVSDDRTVMNLRASDEATRVRALLADGGDYPLVSATREWGSTDETRITVRCHWVQGLSSPQLKKLIQIVNHRAVKDRMLQQALLAPFRQALLPGQFPAAALFLEIHPSQLDVNAHPTKTELRFLKSREVFHAVESLVSSMIQEHGAPAYVPQNSGSGQWRASESQPVATQAWDFTAPPTVPLHSPQDVPSWAASTASSYGPESARENRQGDEPEASSIAMTPPTSSSPAHRDHPFRNGRFAGIVFNTYVLYDLGEELGMIDQHAAHERIRYELLKKRAMQGGQGAGPQALLIPEAVRFDVEARATVEERLELLARMGFEAELFGEDTVLFRSLPGEWGTDSLRPRLKNLLDRLISLESTPEPATSGSMLLDEDLFERLASEACHSAIRAGDRLENEEATALVQQLFQCEHPWNCPHGRPTVVRVPKGRFEEWFQRRV